MHQEIERKFLVKASWQPQDEGTAICQGYLNSEQARTVRVRIRGSQAYLTIKGENHGIERLELEYDIPVPDAKALLQLCEKPLLEKIRYTESFAGHLWEIDRFLGENEGLLVAEVEMASPDEKVSLPSWVSQEVSGDVRYYNSNLIKNPYKQWKKC